MVEVSDAIMQQEVRKDVGGNGNKMGKRVGRLQPFYVTSNRLGYSSLSCSGHYSCIMATVGVRGQAGISQRDRDILLKHRRVVHNLEFEVQLRQNYKISSSG